MKAITFVLFGIILCTAVIIAGCTSQTTSTSAPTRTPTVCPTAAACVCPIPVVTTAPAGSLTVGPTQTLPPKNEVIVNVDQKDIDGKIPVTFGGGDGQNAVKNIKIVLTRVDGSTEVAYLLPEYGQSVILSGTDSRGYEKTAFDRVEVYVNLYSGETYKVIDVLRPYRERA
jgi:hypothetical protein